MGIVKRLLALVFVLLISGVAAVEPEDVQAHWDEVVGDGTASIMVEPRLPKEGEQFVATLTYQTSAPIVGANYQMCNVGNACFVGNGTLYSGGEGVWILETAREQEYSQAIRGLRHFDAGERIGWTYFLHLENGTTLSVPHGDDCANVAPEEWVPCEETHYFAIDIQAGAKSTPAPGLFAPLLVAVALAGRRRA